MSDPRPGAKLKTLASEFEPVQDPVDISKSFLLAIRRGTSAEEHAEALAALPDEELATALDTDAARLAFWLNVYNGFAQRALAEDPEQYHPRRTFFGTPQGTVAGQELSLDAIEHGILRRSYSKWTLGYVRSPSRTRFQERHEPSQRDPRIHFAVNCGAASCPPIAAYERDAVDDQLDIATAGYLEQTVTYNPDSGWVRVPRVMIWFRGDWGRKRDLLAFLRAHDQLPSDASPWMAYHDWDWSLDRGDWAAESAMDCADRE